MTDLPIGATYVPTRLGTTLGYEEGQLVGRLDPPPAICGRGTIPMAAVVFLVDVVGGLTIDKDPDAWAFTSDLSIRLPLERAPRRIDTTATPLRNGRRSAICETPLMVDDRSWGSCFVSFAKVSRRADDPPKPPFDPEAGARRMASPALETAVRDAVGIVSQDPAAGVANVELRPELLNPAGALQGAMVAALAEAAAEDLADHHLGSDRPHVVTEMEIRYLAQNRTSPIASRAWFIGPPSDGLVRVDLVDDDGRGRLTTSVTARVRPAP